MNNRGNARDVIVLGVILFAVGLMAFIGYNTFNVMADKMLNTTAFNSSAHASQALNDVKGDTTKVDNIVLGVFIGFSVAIIVTAWFIGGNILFVLLYFLFMVVGVVVGMVLSNAWEGVTQASVFGASYVIGDLPITNWLVTNLPVVLVVVGFIGMIAMFAKPYMAGGGEYE